MDGSAPGTGLPAGTLARERAAIQVSFGRALESSALNVAGTGGLVLVPGLCLPVDPSFLRSLLATHLVSVTGEPAGIAEVVVDGTTGDAFPTIIESRDATGMPSFTPWPGGDDALPGVFPRGGTGGDTPVDDASLHALLERLMSRFSAPGGPVVDAVRVIDVRFLDLLAKTVVFPPAAHGPVAIESLVLAVLVHAFAISGGWIKEFPSKNILLASLASFTMELSVDAMRLVARLVATCVPSRDLVAGMLGCGAVSFASVQRDKHGRPSLLGAGVMQGSALACIEPGLAMARLIDVAGRKPALLVDIEPLVHVAIDVMSFFSSSSIIGSLVDITRTVVDHLVCFARGFKEHWDVRPDPAITSFFSRISCRLVGLRCDVPRLDARGVVAWCGKHAARRIAPAPAVLLCLVGRLGDDGFPRAVIECLPGPGTRQGIFEVAVPDHVIVNPRGSLDEVARAVQEYVAAIRSSPRQPVIVVSARAFERLARIVNRALFSRMPSPWLLVNLMSILVAKNCTGFVATDGSSPAWRRARAYRLARMAQAILFRRYRS